MCVCVCVCVCVCLPSPSEVKRKTFHHSNGSHQYLPHGRVTFATLITIFVVGANAIDMFLEWNVALDNTIQPVSLKQPI